VLCSPMIELHPSQMGVPIWAARLYAEAGCLAGLSNSSVYRGRDWRENKIPFENNLLTFDRERYMRNRGFVEASPQLTLGPPTVGWLRAAMRSMALVGDPSFARGVTMPILFFIAGKDVIVSQSAIEDFSARMKSGTHVILADARHEILQETDDVRGRFWATFDAFMNIGQKAEEV
jgi:lysophospholipase